MKIKKLLFLFLVSSSVLTFAGQNDDGDHDEINIDIESYEQLKEIEQNSQELYKQCGGCKINLNFICNPKYLKGTDYTGHYLCKILANRLWEELSNKYYKTYSPYFNESSVDTVWPDNYLGFELNGPGIQEYKVAAQKKELRNDLGKLLNPSLWLTKLNQKDCSVISDLMNKHSKLPIQYNFVCKDDSPSNYNIPIVEEK